MGRTDEKILDNLEHAIAIAQDKLTDINSAINRDQFIAEQKAKDILVLKKEEDSIKKNIEKLKQSEIEVWVVLDKAKEKNDAERSEMTSRKAKIQAEIDALGIKIGEETEKLAKIAVAHEKKVKILTKEYLLLVAENNNKREKLQETMREEENKQKNIANETKKADDKLNWILELIKNNEKKLEETNKVLADLIMKKLEVENLDHDIVTKKTENTRLDKLIIVLNEIINKLQQEKESLNKELLPLREENKTYIANKFALKTEREQLENKENYIKSKYEEAGLVYSK